MTIKLSAYDPYDFANRRHIGPSPAEIDAMEALLRRAYELVFARLTKKRQRELAG